VPRPRVLLLVAALVVAPHAVPAVELPVSARTLPNGLRVLVHEDRSAPVVSSYVFYRSGSRNERRGQTGIAHLFEHMMFNGGKKFGPGTFDDLIEGNGGSTNGYTTKDLTAYLNNVPRETLPLVLDLEGDRMANLAITAANLEQERGIVMEERRLRIDNQVLGAMSEALSLHAFVRSPYRWNTVGFMEDLQRITLEEARAYFRTYYAPNNAVLVLAGDVEAEAAFALAERHFGRIRRGPPPPPVDGREPPQEGERRAVVRKAAELPAVLVGWHGVRVADPDRAALDVLERLLGDGDAARLPLDLVREHEVATETSADNAWTIDPELFTVYAQAAPGRTAAEVEARIDAVVARLAREPVDAAELAKAKTRLRADLVRSLKTVSGKANRIGFAEVVFGDHRALERVEREWEAVESADVRRVAGAYLVPARRTVVTLEPVRGDGAP
jgi:predicted Zn-dependent peptidase